MELPLAFRLDLISVDREPFAREDVASLPLVSDGTWHIIVLACTGRQVTIVSCQSIILHLVGNEYHGHDFRRDDSVSGEISYRIGTSSYQHDSASGSWVNEDVI